MGGPTLRRIRIGLRLPPRSAQAIASLDQGGEGDARPRIHVGSSRHASPVSISFGGGAVEARAQRLLAGLLRGSNPRRPAQRLRLEQILDRLGSNRLALDHVGLTIPAGGGSAARLNALRALLAPRVPLVAHPGVSAWLFVIPAFSADADPPKLELALAPEWTGCPIVQLDVRTPCPLDQLRALFEPRDLQPVPVLEELAISLFAKVPWRRFALRVDLRARPAAGELGFTDWLISYGSRVGAESLSRDPGP